MNTMKPKPANQDARDLANTNTTSTLFLGNRTKSWMLSSPVTGPSPARHPKPTKRVNPSRLRLDTHSATNSVSSTQSVTRDDWSLSTNGEDSMRTSEVDGEPTERRSSASDPPLHEPQQYSGVLQTKVQGIPHSVHPAHQDKASRPQASHGGSPIRIPAAPSRVWTAPGALPSEVSTTTPDLPSVTITSTATISTPSEVGSPVKRLETGTIQTTKPPRDTGIMTAGAQSPVGGTALTPISATVTAMNSEPQIPAPVAPMNPILAELRPRLSFGVALHRDAEGIRLAFGQSELDVARIKFLIEACETEDQDALLLHQIYVAYSLQVPTPGVTYPGHCVPEKAFDILSYILGSNGALNKRLERYFLDFPAPHSILHQAVLRDHIQRTTITLNLLADNWDNAIEDCTSRGFPFSPAEVRNTFGLASHRLSLAVFTSMLHRLGLLPVRVNGSAATRIFEEFRPSNSLDQWRQAFSEAMRNHSLVPRDRRSSSGNTPSAAQTSPLHSPPVNPATPHVQNYQGPVGTMHGPKQSVVPPTSQSSVTPTFRAGSGVWRAQQWVRPGSNHQQPMVQSHEYTQRAESRGLQYPPQHQFQAPPTAPIQQQYQQVMNGSINRNRPGPQRGRFRVESRPPPAGTMPSQSAPRNRQRRALGNESQTPTPQQTPLLPAPGWNMPQAVHPNPDRIALHQAHLRSPIARIVDSDGNPDTNLRLYQVTAKLVMAPHRLDPAEHYFHFDFDVSHADIGHKLVCTPPPHATLTMASNLFKPGALRWRLKCVARPLSNDSPPTKSDFCCSPSSWPEHIFISFNQLDDIVPTRKTHYGRDLTSDLTNAVIEGQNQLRITFDATSTDKRYRKNFWLGVECVNLVSHEDIIKNLKTIPHEEALDHILKSMKGALPTNSPATESSSARNDTNDPATNNPTAVPTTYDSDDDLIITNPTLTIDVTDPFTSTLWDTPVRTLSCRHRECFDLETFLTSRPRSQLAGPAEADDWRCPHCQRDARPGQLVRDGFLVRVREELVREGKEDVKSVEVRDDGTWGAKLEDDGAGKKGDGVGAARKGGETPATEGSDGNGDGGTGTDVTAGGRWEWKAEYGREFDCGCGYGVGG